MSRQSRSTAGSRPSPLAQKPHGQTVSLDKPVGADISVKAAAPAGAQLQTTSGRQAAVFAVEVARAKDANKRAALLFHLLQAIHDLDRAAASGVRLAEFERAGGVAEVAKTLHESGIDNVTIGLENEPLKLSDLRDDEEQAA